MKTKRTLKKVLAVVLCISMTLCLIPAGANAADNTTEQATEVVSLREENVKHFDMGNGTYQAIAYSHPVHEMDSEGNWQDIDFSMNLTHAKGVRAYTNSAGTALAANYTANQPLVTLSGEGTSIAVTLVSNANTATMSTQAMASTATVAAELTATQTQIQTFEDAQAASFSNTLLYENVMPGIDLEYIVDPWTVKENIIVNQPASKYEYRFKLDINGLYPALQEDGSILIYNSATEAAEYEIPAPYMYDATGEMSFDVSYAITGSNGIYYLTVTADEDWINTDEREFPVVIDPSVTVHQDINMDTYINQDTPNEARGGYKFFFVGENEVAYIYTPTPALLSIATLDSAHLSLYYFYKDFVTTGYVNFSAHLVTDFYWAEESLKWTDVVGADYETYDNYRFGLSSNTLGTASTYGTARATSSSPKSVTVNIKDAVEVWRSDDSRNKGIGLRYVTSSPNKSVMFRSTEGPAAYRPQLSYSYHIEGEAYYRSLQDIYGFSEDQAVSIMEIYRKVDEKYPNSTSMEKAWIGCRLLGGLCYGDYADTVKNQIQWNDLANKVFDSSESEERKYYTETLGLSLSEYIELREFIRAQHNDAPSYDNGDFSHMQISLAARLACALDKDGVASNVYGDDETASYYAGWLGDAVIGNPPSFGNDDYIADLDAENIYHQISRGNTIVIASHLYFQELISETRAKIFVKHISYELVKEKVGIGLLADDNYTLEEIIDTYPDTYNFLCSIRDGLNEIRNYIE